MKTDEQIISAFNEICNTLAGRKLAAKVQTLLIRSTRGNELINRFLDYVSGYKNSQGDERELYDAAMTGVFEYLIDEMNARCDAEVTHDERFYLFCFFSKMG